MKYSHIATGKHMEGLDPRFRINTAPGIMEPKHGVNEAHGSFLQRQQVVELRDELTAWLEAHPTLEEQVLKITAGNLDAADTHAIISLIRAAGGR